MTRESMQRLRLDRRLAHHQGWISEAELAKELDGLPDAASKATTLGEVADESESSPPEPAPAPVEPPSF